MVTQLPYKNANKDGSVSGFDNTAEQECENLICTHPGNNATCSQEGVRFTPTPTSRANYNNLKSYKKSRLSVHRPPLLSRKWTVK